VLARRKPPKKLTEGNTVIPPGRLLLEETLDFPEASSGPWSDELALAAHSEVLDHFRSLNFENVLGYGRSTTGGDPTPSREFRHLILLENASECQLHIQISQADLDARNFDAIQLVWVDFG